ncbi:MAG: 2-oxo acid dehydrogenase subunit E2 [Bacteroidales bacterium]|nr:2-oxo acid dehydrogenase subunit E2 [Bacteroidales bacterium]
MKYVFKFPDIGEGLDEGIIVEWKVKKGQQVKVGESLVTMETDKVVTDIPSPKDGIIAEMYGKVGETIHVGEALVEIEMEGTASEVAAAEASKSEMVEEEGAGVVGTLEVAGNSAVLSASHEGVATEATQTDTKRKALATPVARAMAKDMGVDINQVKGTGPGGRVMKDDIIKFAQGKSTSTNQKTSISVSSEMETEVVAMSQIRKTIAKNMIASKHNAAHMTIFDEVEISTLDSVRKKYKADFEKRGSKLTYLAFVVKATALALKKFKALNSEMDMENSQMIYKKYYNIGIAVDTEKGLVVPVIKNADTLSIFDISMKIAEFSEKARTATLTLDEMKDGTFTITSYGSIGGKFAVPVINYPQAGILGVGRISQQPVVIDNQLAIGLVLPLSLSVDHRIADGGETARFLNQVMSYLSEPVSLLMD